MGKGMRGWLLVVVQFVMILVLLLLPWRVPTPVSLVLGAALVVAGVVLGVQAARRLGRALTPTPVPIAGAGLRTDGPFRYIRHPIYSAVLLGTAGLAVALGSWLTWTWAALMLAFFWAKSRWEDRLLHEEYGADWEQWSRRTGALVPRWRQAGSP